MNILLSGFVILTVLIISESAGIPDRCLVTPLCSSSPENVYTTDGKGNCIKLRNNCFMEIGNCERLSEGKSELKEIPKDECQALCKNTCASEHSPVCGVYINNEKRIFENQCEMDNEICRSDKTYLPANMSACK